MTCCSPSPSQSLLLPHRYAIISSAVFEVLHILRTTIFSSQAQTQLNRISHHITPTIVHAVLDETAQTPEQAFRFFLFTLTRKSLRTSCTHKRIIAILQSHGALESAWDFIQKFNDAAIPSRAFAAIISAYAAKGMVENAVEAFGKMKEFQCCPDTFTCNAILKILVDNGVIVVAMAIYNQMVKRDIWLNRFTYTILVNGLCKAGKRQDALLLFDEMLKRDILPDTVVYNMLLQVLCEDNMLEKAVNLIEKLPCKLGVVTCTILLNGFCRAGKIDEALEHLKKFEEDGFVLDSYGYGCLISSLFKAGKFEEACKIYEEMLEKNVVSTCAVYSMMMKGYIGAGKVEEAFSLFNEMISKGIDPDAFCYNNLLYSLCDIGLVDKAHSLFLDVSLSNQFPNSSSFYSTMISGLCKNGFLHEAQELYAEMQKLGYTPTLTTSNILLNALCKAGKLKEAHSHFSKMKMGEKPLSFPVSHGSKRVHNIESLHQLVEELCMSDQVLKAYKLLCNTVNSGVVPNIVTYNILINSLCKTRNIDDAMKLFEEVQLKGYFPSVVTYGTLIDGLLKVHREEDASMVYQHMLQSGCSPNISIYSSIMRTLCSKGKVSQTIILWLNYLVQLLPEEVETITLARKEYEQGNLEGMVKRLVEMEKKHGTAKAFPYTTWLIGFCEIKRVDEAFIIFTILREYNIDATLPSCAFLINHLGQEWKLASAVHVMLYALDKCFCLDRPIGNKLLVKLCKMNNYAARVVVLRMHLAGYDVDKYLWRVTKYLLYS